MPPPLRLTQSCSAPARTTGRLRDVSKARRDVCSSAAASSSESACLHVTSALLSVRHRCASRSVFPPPGARSPAFRTQLQPCVPPDTLCVALCVRWTTHSTHVGRCFCAPLPCSICGERELQRRPRRRRAVETDCLARSCCLAQARSARVEAARRANVLMIRRCCRGHDDVFVFARCGARLQKL